MIWTLFILSLGLVSARSVSDADLDTLEEELGRLEQDVERAETNELGHGRRYFTRVSELGDILLTDEQARQGINLNKYSTMKWPNGRVPYTIRERDFSRSEVNSIEYAIKDMNRRLAEQGSRVQLVKRGRERDYVRVFSGSGCYSYLGKVGGEQALSLQRNGCVYNTTIQHEFMHAIGFTHEQNRADRDEYVEVLWDNIPEDWHSQYEKVSGDDFHDMGGYEHNSIMHYPWWAPDSGGLDAFNVLGKEVNKYDMGNGENDGATRLDIEKINTLYS